MAYLLQSQVVNPNDDGLNKPDFIVLPPLEKINEKDAVVLMIKSINHKCRKIVSHYLFLTLRRYLIRKRNRPYRKVTNDYCDTESFKTFLSPKWFTQIWY